MAIDRVPEALAVALRGVGVEAVALAVAVSLPVRVTVELGLMVIWTAVGEGFGLPPEVVERE
jgi:hypothetical protein